MRQYLDLLRDVRLNGVETSDRTGTGTFAVFGRQMRFDLSSGFPLLTTKRIHLRSMAGELLWFLRGETNVESLREAGITIWDEWADENGDLGPIYGKQWRAWSGSDGKPIDQIADAIERLRSDSDSRRIVVSAWNPSELEAMSLPPCHCLFQFRSLAGRLSCHVYQRSADVFLGVPFNIASYALLTEMVAAIVGLKTGELIYSFGDVHLYRNHVAQADEQLSRTPRSLPRLELRRIPDAIDGFVIEDVVVSDYDPHPAIRAPIAV